MAVQSRLPIVPASFFGIVLGFAGLGSAWRAAHRVWQLPSMIGEALLVVATLMAGSAAVVASGHSLF